MSQLQILGLVGPKTFSTLRLFDEAIAAAAAASHLSKYFPILKVWSQYKFLKFTISRGLAVYIYHKGVLFQFVYGVQSQLVTELQGRWHCEETEYYCDFILGAAGIIDLTCAASACCANLLLQVPCLGTENIARTSLPKSETLQSSKWGHRPDEVKLPGNIWTPPASWI